LELKGFVVVVVEKNTTEKIDNIVPQMNALLKVIEKLHFALPENSCSFTCSELLQSYSRNKI